MALKLERDEKALLEQVVAKRKPELLPLLGFADVRELTEPERDELQDLLALELADTGLGEDGRANERGHTLDDLMGKLGTIAGTSGK